MKSCYEAPAELLLGKTINTQVPEADQRRQRSEVEAILRRLRSQPGVVLADEVGMGKTFVALGVACSIAATNPRGPVIIMAPANLIGKWEQDLKAFCELYLRDRCALPKEGTPRREFKAADVIRYGVARHSVELMKLLDDRRRERCHLVFLSHGAMGRQQTDKWVRLALVAEALRRHGRGGAQRLIQVKKQIHRYLAELLYAIGEQKATDWGDKLWQRLLKTDPVGWRDIYNDSVRHDRKRLDDDPVPKAVTRALRKAELKPLATALEQMPIRNRGGAGRVSERLDAVRKVLREVEEALWKELLASARWRSPLLIMDEAHHLKNPKTLLARQLQCSETVGALRTGDGAMARSFDRMVFLTATPFQLGHTELVRVLRRFGDVRWDEDELGEQAEFHRGLDKMLESLDDSQRSAMALQRAWSRMSAADVGDHAEAWWQGLSCRDAEDLTPAERAVKDAFDMARRYRHRAERILQPWIIRHNKGAYWSKTSIPRRRRLEGGAIAGTDGVAGLPIPPEQLLPFFLAARSVVSPGKDLLGEALSSSYEAFRFTRANRQTEKDDQEGASASLDELSQSAWYLQEFDQALERCSGMTHPKIQATVRRVVDLWEQGEKVLVFAFYRHTCRALRIHISDEIRRRLGLAKGKGFKDGSHEEPPSGSREQVKRVQKRYFDDTDSPGRKAVDAALRSIVQTHLHLIEKAGITRPRQEQLIDVMRRFLRVSTTLARCFPLDELDTMDPAVAVRRTLDHADESGISWRHKFDAFIEFLGNQCSSEERVLYLSAANTTQTGSIYVTDQESEDSGGAETLANVQEATGGTKRDTRERLMRAFNTPFFPDILVCSEVMGEGVDLQRFCRHVIHHDLAWNHSVIEQRTGRIDRLGCKAEGQHPILVYLPYLAGTADERQFRVMTDREKWFRVVMGQEAVARLITEDDEGCVPLPEAVANALNFKLGL